MEYFSILQTSLLVRELNRLAFLNPALKKEVSDYVQSFFYIILYAWKVPTQNLTFYAYIHNMLHCMHAYILKMIVLFQVNDFIAVIQTTTPGISATGYFSIGKPLLASVLSFIQSACNFSVSFE